MGLPLTTTQPRPIWDTEIYWPAVSVGTVDGSAFQQSGAIAGTRIIDGSESYVVWGADFGPGTSVMRVIDEITCGNFPLSAQRTARGFPFYIKTDRANLAAGLEIASFYRVYIVDIIMQTDIAGGPTDESGIYFIHSAGVPSGWPSTGTHGFGVIGIGPSNTWHWVTGETSPGPAVEAVDLGLTVTQWNHFQFQIINSSGGRDASVQLSTNGTVRLSRNWVAAPALTPLIPPDNKFVFTARNGDGGGGVRIASMRIRAGRFLANEVEVDS